MKQTSSMVARVALNIMIGRLYSFKHINNSAGGDGALLIPIALAMAMAMTSKF